MAALVRVTGPVGHVESRPVTSKDGREFVFHTATVLVAGRGAVDVRFNPERMDGRTFSEGDVVDLLVSVDVYGNRLSVDMVSDYSAKLRESEALAFLSAAEQSELANA